VTELEDTPQGLGLPSACGNTPQALRPIPNLGPHRGMCMECWHLLWGAVLLQCYRPRPGALLGGTRGALAHVWTPALPYPFQPCYSWSPRRGRAGCGGGRGGGGRRGARRSCARARRSTGRLGARGRGGRAGRGAPPRHTAALFLCIRGMTRPLLCAFLCSGI